MAYQDTVTCPAFTPTLITPDAPAGEVVFQNKTGGRVWLSAAVGETAPTDRDGAILFPSGSGERSFAIADMFPGLTGADRLYVEAEIAGGVFISYA